MATRKKRATKKAQPFRDPVAEIQAAKAFAMKSEGGATMIRGENWLDMIDAVNLKMEAGWKPISMVYVEPTVEEKMTPNLKTHPWYTMMVFNP